MHKVPKEVARTDEAYYSNLSHVLATLKERNPSHQGISKWEKVSVGPFFFPTMGKARISSLKATKLQSFKVQNRKEEILPPMERLANLSRSRQYF